MKVVYSLRIRKELKEEMERYKDEVNWNEEIEKFIENKLYQIRKKKILNEINRLLENLPEGEPSLVDKLLREDRDYGH